jgi:hypothetical protein
MAVDAAFEATITSRSSSSPQISGVGAALAALSPH